MKRPQDIESDIGGFQSSAWHDADGAGFTPLAEKGRPWPEIRAELLRRKVGDYDWRGGRLPIYVYHSDDELLSVSREAYNLYFSENALGRRAFPSLAKMEEEVISMVLSLFRAPNSAAGSFTSGGTESIFLALKAARDRFKANHSPGLAPPNVVLPRTAHPAFDKAAEYLGAVVIRTEIDDDLRGSVAALEAAIDDRTMLIVGSAPCYPYGVFDPISKLGEIATARQVCLHVDACLGGFLAPFARDEGYSIPDFDFCIPGVTSLSADLHKFGFAARGASVILYRSAHLKSYQGFQFRNWPRGAYATETFLGSRPGGAVASAWAVAQYLGNSGYRQLARTTLETKDRLMRGVEAIRGLQVVRPSELNILLYRSCDARVDINAVGDMLGERGWFVGRSSEPQALHLALNTVHAPIIDRYLADLREVVAEARISGRNGLRDEMTY